VLYLCLVQPPQAEQADLPVHAVSDHLPDDRREILACDYDVYES